MDYRIRNATQGEMETIIGWAAAEGWNPGIHDAEIFYTADRNGFFLGLLNDQPISSISAVNYDGKFGFF